MTFERRWNAISRRFKLEKETGKFLSDLVKKKQVLVLENQAYWKKEQ